MWTTAQLATALVVALSRLGGAGNSRRVVSIDPQARRVQDDAGEEYGYEKLVLATGGRWHGSAPATAS